MPIQRISYSWLKKLIPLAIEDKEVERTLSRSGVEVADMRRLGAQFEGIVVGDVRAKSKHPKADRLSVCMVFDGEKEFQVVCGAPNVEMGQRVAFAKVGASVPRNQHDPHGSPFVLGAAVIRGVQSEGMICSGYELGISDDADGIFVLSQDALPGTPFALYLGMDDTIFELEITANRGDWMSHLGVARELAAALDMKAALPSVAVREGSAPAKTLASVTIKDPEKCPRYVARIITGVKVASSPEWMQKALEAVNVRPINNIVDVTNYVLMETGQPLHAFDLERLSGKAIVVRTAGADSTFTTLDGKERKLEPDMLMICDDEKSVAIAGVMGGLNSEITPETTNVLLESAFFLPTSIRRTSKKLGLSTDASQRFERGCDIEMASSAADRAAALIAELAGGTVAKGAIDIYPGKMSPRRISLRPSRVNRVLGTSLSNREVAGLLKRLEIAVGDKAKDEIVATVPSYRNDLVSEIDLIEEIARLFGYDNIEPKPSTSLVMLPDEKTERFAKYLRELMSGWGFNEMMSVSLTDEKGSAYRNPGTAIALMNPLGKESAYLRPTLLYGALNSVKLNFARSVKDLRFFEIGNIFYRVSGNDELAFQDVREEERLLVLITGRNLPEGYGNPSRPADMFDIKGVVEALLAKVCLDKYRFIYYDSKNSLNRTRVDIEIQGQSAGYFGSVEKEICERFDINENVFACEISLEALHRAWSPTIRFSEPSSFPPVTRDLAFIVQQNITNDAVVAAMKKTGIATLESVTLFDIFAGEKIGAGKKNMAYSLRFRSNERTLTDTEVDGLIERIVRSVQTECGAELRTF